MDNGAAWVVEYFQMFLDAFGHFTKHTDMVDSLDLLLYALKTLLCLAIASFVMAAISIGPSALCWPFFAVLSAVMSLIAFPAVPVVVFLWMLPKYFGWLQKPFDWLLWPFMTYDSPIDGDGGHIERWPGPDTSGHRFWRSRLWNWCYLYFRRVAWLWRNRVYNVSYYLFGRKLSGRISTKGNGNVSDRPFTPGYSFQHDENGVWELYVVKKIPFLALCTRIRIGWSIPENYREGMEHRCMLKTHYISIRSTQLK